MATYRSLKDFSDPSSVLKNYDRFYIAGLNFQVQSASFFEIDNNTKRLSKRLGLKDISNLCKKHNLKFMGDVPVGDLIQITALVKEMYEIYENIPRWKKFFHNV